MTIKGTVEETKKSAQEKGDRIMKKSKIDHEKWFEIETKDYLKNEKVNKKNTQETDTRIYQKKTDKN